MVGLSSIILLDSEEQDLTMLTDIPFHDKPSTCSRCGKFIPRNASMGWQKDNVQVADLEKAKNDSGGCEVCRMVLDGFMSYRDHVGKAIPLPSSISIKCVPGRSMIVKRGVIKPPSGSENGSTSQEQTSDDILGTQGLEFFIKPGN